MKRPTMLYQALFIQINRDLAVSTERDIAYLRYRLEHEGLSFLTITLPTLSDSLESGIESGRFSLPNGFKPISRRGTLPAFMQGLFKRVFHLDGKLLDDPCPESIYWIRQVSRFFKKPKLPCSPRREAVAVQRFKQVEEELRDAEPQISRIDPILDSVASILWSSIFPNVDDHRIICGHGPGVTADRLRSNERRRIRKWYNRSEFSFPAADHAFPNYGLAWDGGSSDGVAGIEYLGIKDEIPVRVVFVPKTMSAPRVIAIEPSNVQFIQQGLSRYVVQELESHRLTAGSVNFTDQSINRRLAYEASKDGSLATIDLSDASDRVSLSLVQRIFRRTPLLEYLEDSRSLSADLPDGSNIVLSKFASMGSALCFPIEASVFYTLILSAIIAHDGLRPSYKTILHLKKNIFVYGDDIIIPSQYVDVVSDYLESYALRVNRRKSFSKSLFRESCGADFFAGHSVLPIYARQMFPAVRSECRPEVVMAWVSTANQFYQTGKWYVAQAIRDLIETAIGERLPRATNPGEGVYHLSFMFNTNVFWNKKYSTYGQRRLCYTPVKQKDNIDGEAVACFNKVFERSQSNHDTGVRYGHLHGWQYRPMVQDRLWQLEQILRLSSYFKHPGATSSTVEGVIRSLLLRWMVDVQKHPLRPYETATRIIPTSVLEIDPTRIDFCSTTRRGVLAMKRRWVAI